MLVSRENSLRPGCGSRLSRSGSSVRRRPAIYGDKNNVQGYHRSHHSLPSYTCDLSIDIYTSTRHHGHLARHTLCGRHTEIPELLCGPARVGTGSRQLSKAERPLLCHSCTVCRAVSYTH